MRPMRVHLLRGELLNSTSHTFVHVMVIDREDTPKAQYWPCCSQYGDDVQRPDYNETLLVPGVSGNQMVRRLNMY